MGGLFALVFGVYCLTLCPGVYPGSSAVATGQAMGLLPGLPVSHPLWLSVSRVVAAIPVFEAPLRLNAFTALFGSLSVVWVFRVSNRIMLELIRPSSELRIVPVGDDTSENQDGGYEGDTNAYIANREDDARERLGATLGGLISALVFAFCAPHWLASISLHAQPFDLLLFLIAVDLVAAYYFTGRLGFCVKAVFLCGVLAVESSTYALISLCLLYFVVQASRRYEHIAESFVLLLMAVGSVGVALNLALGCFRWGDAGAGASVGCLEGVKLFAQSYKASLFAKVPLDLLCFTGALPLLGLLLATISLRASVFFRDEIVRWKWRMMNGLCTVFAIMQLLNAPKSVWAMARENGTLPVLPALAVAFMTGMLFLYWFQMTMVATVSDDDVRLPFPFWKRFTGLAADALLVVLVFRAFSLNMSDADGRKAMFADAMAKEILDLSSGAQCVLTDGTLDLNVLVRSDVGGRKQAVVPSASDTRLADGLGSLESRLPGLVVAPRGDGAKDLPQDAVERWLREHPGEHKQIAAVGTPSVWLRTGRVALPNGLVYSGASEVGSIDLSALHAKNMKVWRSILPLLKDETSLLPTLKMTRAEVRMYVSRLANDWGVLLDQSSRVDEALDAYTEALDFDGNNLSAALNRFSLCLRKNRAAKLSVVELAEHPTLRVEPARYSEMFDTLRGSYGSLIYQPADRFLPLLLAQNPSCLSAGAEVFHLLDRWLSSQAEDSASPLCGQNDGQRKLIRSAALHAHMEECERNPELIRAVQEHVEGQSAEAEVTVRRYVSNHPNNLMARSLLSELLIRKGAPQEVSSSILPAMRATAGGADNAFVLMVQGGVCMNMSSTRLQEARACLLRALALNPHLGAAHDWLLEVDARLGNDAVSESDALLVIGSDSGHPFANAVLGHLRSVQNRREDAEVFFRKSLSGAPSAVVYTELSELLKQQNRLTEAEQQARLAIRFSPCCGSAWSVLSRILMAGDRSEEASDALRCATAFSRPEGGGSISVNRLALAQRRERQDDALMRSVTVTR